MWKHPGLRTMQTVCSPPAMMHVATSDRGRPAVNGDLG